MNFIFGPVISRRLGRSLGIDLFANKICNLNCIYCELGVTSIPVSQRGNYSDTQAIIEEINSFCADAHRMTDVDVLTVTAKGEPTLHLGLGEILRHIKQQTDKQVAVLTNGTTLMDDNIRQELTVADIVIPSLDSARMETFLRIDRPCPGIDLQRVIQGLTLFSHEYPGKLWLEILLAQGINDTQEDVKALVSAIKPMRLDRIQLNTVVRPPAEFFARPVTVEQLLKIADILQNNLAIPVDLPFVPTAPNTQSSLPVTPETTNTLGAAENLTDQIVEMLKRRPCTAADIDQTFHLGSLDKVEQLLEPMLHAGVVRKQEHKTLCFYQLSSPTQ